MLNTGRDGKGLKTHAFNETSRFTKDTNERIAIEKYTNRYGGTASTSYENALDEILIGNSIEAKFVKAIDKLQSFAYVIFMKKGNMIDSHVKFTLRYAEKIMLFFPWLDKYYHELNRRLIKDIAKSRNIDVESLEYHFGIKGGLFQLSSTN